MTSQMNAVTDSTDLHAVALPPSGKAKSHQPLWDDPRLAAFLASPRGELASVATEQTFDHEPLGSVKAGHMLALSSSMIVAGSAEVMIEQTDAGCVLTGTRGSTNDCRLIFRYAYSDIHCELRVMSGATEAHIGFLGWKGLTEVQSFKISPRRGTRRDDSGWLTTTLDYHADPLCEVQGIVWRGGLLQIARINLKP